MLDKMTSDPHPKLLGFLSDHESEEKLVEIMAEPDPIYIEEARDSLELNFDFRITGLTNKELEIRFIKCAVYDEIGRLVTFKHLNHNGVGNPGIYTIGSKFAFSNLASIKASTLSDFNRAEAIALVCLG